MENQQTTGTAVQDQPLNTEGNGNSVAKTRNARITKIKQKFLPGLRITLLLSLAIYLAMLVIGILAVHKCPVEENIPLFLIATGAIGLLTKIMTYARERISRHMKTSFVESSLYTVETVFLILGCYWVYKEYPPSYDPLNHNYCQKTAYKFAFVYVTVILALFMAALAGFVCFLGCICFLARGETDDDAEGRHNEPEGNGS